MSRQCAIEDCDGPAYCRGWCRKHYVRWQRHGDPLTHLRSLPAPARFAQRITVNPKTGCWEWTAARNDRGYGLFAASHPPGSLYAHRWSYEHHIGPIPGGLVLDHLCRNPPCVNPAHLEPVTNAENIRRGRSFQREKTHCIHGHEFTPENTYFRLTGGRRCRTCQRAADRRWLERPMEPAQNLDLAAENPSSSAEPSLPLDQTNE